jgi:hypothetical protein
MRVKQKNPNRVAGQLKAMIRRRERDLLWIALFWAVPLLAAVLCFLLGAPWWAKGLSVLGILSGLMTYFASRSQLADWKARLAEAEAGGHDRPDGVD